MRYGNRSVEMRRSSHTRGSSSHLNIIASGKIMRTVIIVPAAPHYPNCHGKEQVWFGRIFRAIQLARDLDAPLIIVGDANGGSDVELFAKLGLSSGVRVYTELNGVAKELKNTRGDMRAAARVLRDCNDLHSVNELVLVTCWYHCLRSTIELRNAVFDTLPDRRYSYRVVPVWDKFVHGIYRLFHPTGELRGVVDALLARPHVMRGDLANRGKPDMTT